MLQKPLQYFIWSHKNKLLQFLIMSEEFQVHSVIPMEMGVQFEKNEKHMMEVISFKTFPNIQINMSFPWNNSQRVYSYILKDQ